MKPRQAARQGIMALVVALLLAGCAETGAATLPSARPTPTIGAPTDTPTPHTPRFPQFTDWRVAYLSGDARLHLVSLDGKTDLTGTTVPLYYSAYLGILCPGSSPDGAHLAYAEANNIAYIDVATDIVTNISVPGAKFNLDRGILWSPDESAFAASESNGVGIVHLPSGASALMPPGATPLGPQEVAGAYGWLDATHVAVEDTAADEAIATPSSGRIQTPQTVATLGRLDITTGKFQPIVTIQSPTMGYGEFSVTPDGSEAVFSNGQLQSYPFTPDVERIDTATGQRTRLWRITGILPAFDGFNQLLWLPHSHLALAGLGYPTTGNGTYELLDIDHDTLMPIALPAFPVAWAPDGRTLILASGPKSGDGETNPGYNNVGWVGAGAFTLTAVTFDSTWRITSSVILTHNAAQIPTLGLARNP